MMKKDHSFVNIGDEATIRRLLRSLNIRTINCFEYFEAVNSKNGHRYRVSIAGQDIICTCPDARNHACKQEMAVARYIGLFAGVI